MVPDLASAAYEWRRELGGFRKAASDSPNVALRNDSFRGYADYMQTLPFLEALGRLMHDAAGERVAILCSETVWWRCHRRLIADVAELLHGRKVVHIMHAGSPQPHNITEGARVLPNGTLQYDALPLLSS